VLISISLDYIAGCSGRASSGRCCPWRGTRERISSAQRLPGIDVSLGVLSICFRVYMSGFCGGYVQRIYTFGSDDRARVASFLRETAAAAISTHERKGGTVSNVR
jgi:hypothetical protein